MFLFKKANTLRHHLDEVLQMRKSIGFIPTMGALHEGHASLVRYSIECGHYTVVSVYVNPTQFNDPDDLKKYPRPVALDLEWLYKLDCNVVFLPTDEEMYPDGIMTVPNVNLAHLNKTLEASCRPGHFEGVMQVVARLLDIVKPDELFMGQKDLQQLAVIRRLIGESGIPVKLTGLPIVRESNGLARSSRNERLSTYERQQASVIYKTLQRTADQYNIKTLGELKEQALNALNHSPFRPEYFEFVRTDDIKIINEKQNSCVVSAVTAVWCDDVRLIDNMEMPHTSNPLGARS